MKRVIEVTETIESIAAAYGTVYDMDGVNKMSIQINGIMDATPSPAVVPSADITHGSDLFELVNHGLSTGVVGQFTTSDTLPTGLSLATDYWVIKIDEDLFKVAATYQDAIDGIPQNITSNGVGDQTFTPTALGTVIIAVIKNNGTGDSYEFDGGAVEVNTNSVFFKEIDCVTARYYRVVVQNSTGVVTVDTKVLAWGDAI